jgi:putative transposase
MKSQQPIEFGKIYHIYNRGNNGENLFLSNNNFNQFLSLYDKYISIVADTYAWCLMPNHFHLLVRVKDEAAIGFLKPKRGQKTPPKKAVPENQFGHLFNAYAKAYNVQNNRHGSLFEHPFKRIEVTNPAYLKQLVYYIHSNPVKHGYAESMFDWPWSSYGSIISVKPTKLSKEPVLGWFDSQSNFIAYHHEKQDLELIKLTLLEE